MGKVPGHMVPLYVVIVALVGGGTYLWANPIKAESLGRLLLEAYPSQNDSATPLPDPGCTSKPEGKGLMLRICH
jgi:hypothetical protein